MNDYNSIKTYVDRTLKEAANISIVVYNKVIAYITKFLEDVNNLILQKTPLRSVEAFVRKQMNKLNDIVRDNVITKTRKQAVSESVVARKSLSLIINTPKTNVNKIKVNNAYIKKVLKKPLETQNYSIEDSLKTLGINLSRDTISMIRRAYKENDTLEISKAFTKNAKGISKKKIKSNVKTVINTAMIQISNSVVEDTFKANKKYIDKVIYTAVMDERTTEYCRDHNNRVYDVDSVKPSLPAHFNCRSVYVPVLKTQTPQQVKQQITP